VTPRRRDDFPEKVKRVLADRAGHECSICRAATSGASLHDAAAVNNVGVAAHIAGARPGSARHDVSMTPAARADVTNGIWLCQTCAKMVDGDPVDWPFLRLLQSKVEAEHRARIALGAKRRHLGVPLLIDAEACHYVKQFRAAFVPVHIVNKRRRPITIGSAWVSINGIRHAPSSPLVNLTVPGLNWLVPPPSRLLAEDALSGAWFFGQSFLGGGSCVEAGPGSRVELFVAPVNGKVQRKRLTFLHPDDDAPGRRIDAFIPDDGSIR